MLDFQKHVSDVVAARAKPDAQRPLRAQLDPALLLPMLAEVLALAERHGTAQLRDAAREVRSTGEARWRALLLDYIAGQEATDPTAEFFVHACVEPYAEHLASTFELDLSHATRACPACGGKPMLAILRPEGEGARRSLLCSFCLTEWEFRRVLCPACGEEQHTKLPVFTNEGFPYIRVEACDTCRHYLLSVDLSKNGFAIPLVDVVASASLDLWAAEKGYSKIATHLLGM